MQSVMDEIEKGSAADWLAGADLTSLTRLLRGDARRLSVPCARRGRLSGTLRPARRLREKASVHGEGGAPLRAQRRRTGGSGTGRGQGGTRSGRGRDHRHDAHTGGDGLGDKVKAHHAEHNASGKAQKKADSAVGVFLQHSTAQTAKACTNRDFLI